MTSASVAPGGEVGAGARSFGDAVEDFGQILGVVVEAREIVGKIWIAVPAVLGFVAVFNFAVVGRIRGGLEKIFEEIDGVVEHVIVRAADVYVELALKFGAELGPDVSDGWDAA